MIDKLIHLFDAFINKNMDINELQNRLVTIQCNSHEEEEKIGALDDKLEEIIYCSRIEDQYEETLQVINDFLQNIN